MNKQYIHDLRIRCSSIHAIMTGSNTKTPKEMFNEAVEERDRLQALNDKAKNKQTVAVANRYSKILTLNKLIESLEPIKNDICISATHASYLRQLYKELKYQRIQEYSSKYTEKGLRSEQDAITLLSQYKGQFFEKNTERFNNALLTGEPDIYKLNQEEGFDVKCSWDLWTFPEQDQELDKKYYWQNMGYMALTGAKSWTTAYCLVNSSATDIQSEKDRIRYRMQVTNEYDEAYLQRCFEVEKNMIFNMEEFKRDNPNVDLEAGNLFHWVYDIPLEERVRTFTVERDEEVIESIYEQVRISRKYMLDNLI